MASKTRRREGRRRKERDDVQFKKKLRETRRDFGIKTFLIEQNPTFLSLPGVLLLKGPHSPLY